jgi:DNA-binding transcriptional ArsR family regulator
MNTQPDIITIASLMGEPARAIILLSLLGGASLPASELASRCHLTPQAISSHLAKLVAGGLLHVEHRGKYRYFRLANSEVGDAIETLEAISPSPPVRSLRQSEEAKALCFARTCYDHLAGRLGVSIMQSLLQHDYLKEAERRYLLTPAGEQWCTHMEIDWLKISPPRRVFASSCFDWSERCDHLSGALGASITARLFNLGWIVRTPTTRAVHLTESGRIGLAHELGIDLKKES